MEKELREIAYQLQILNKNFEKLLEKTKDAKKKAEDILSPQIGSAGENLKKHSEK